MSARVRVARRPGGGSRPFGIFAADQVEIGSTSLGVGGRAVLSTTGESYVAYFFARRRDAVEAAERAGFLVDPA